MARSRRGKPERTCISCGAKGLKWGFVRLVLDSKGSVVRDNNMSAPGRGAYVCDNVSCLEELSRKNRLFKAFRGKTNGRTFLSL